MNLHLLKGPTIKILHSNWFIRWNIWKRINWWLQKATTGKDINFMIIEKSAVIKYDKHKANNIIRPEDNQESDGYMQKYRKYGIADTYENKVSGIYLSHKA